MNADNPLTGFRIRSLLLLAAVFASGSFAGIAADRLARRDSRETSLFKRPAVENGIPTRLLRLGLTQEQQRRMRAISTRWQPRADSVMESLIPRVQEIEHGMFQEMACVLTPAQDSAYLAWRKREGLNQAEGEEQLSRVRSGTCPGEKGRSEQ
jgi:hypothetical protein